MEITKEQHIENLQNQYKENAIKNWKFFKENGYYNKEIVEEQQEIIKTLETLGIEL